MDFLQQQGIQVRVVPGIPRLPQFLLLLKKQLDIFCRLFRAPVSFG
jgi:hypothetical protein